MYTLTHVFFFGWLVWDCVCFSAAACRCTAPIHFSAGALHPFSLAPTLVRCQRRPPSFGSTSIFWVGLEPRQWGKLLGIELAIHKGATPG